MTGREPEPRLEPSTEAGPDARAEVAADRTDGEAVVTRHEERLVTGTEVAEAGRVRVRKHVEEFPIEQTVDRGVEEADSERVPAAEGDSGEVETLPDGSVSIPVFEEVLVVTKKLVVRERVIVRKRTVVDEVVLRADLKREHVSIDADESALAADEEGSGGPG